MAGKMAGRADGEMEGRLGEVRRDKRKENEGRKWRGKMEGKWAKWRREDGRKGGRRNWGETEKKGGG